MPTIADGGGRGGVQEPLILADVICEQPLTGKIVSHVKGSTPPRSKSQKSKIYDREQMD